ncbi:hypothetical protein GGF46_003591 [Coemansia sp. RSA 552]|nr:hypothetical protein GGF46_003591 [Coemansia sp. RSA 552]
MGDLHFELTSRLRTACAALKNVSLPDSPAMTRLAHIGASTESNPETISLADVKLLSQKLRQDVPEHDHVWVHQLLQGSKIHIDRPAPKPRNPELVARLDKIKRQLEEQEYLRMTSGVAPHGFKSGQSKEQSPFPAVPGVRAGKSAGAVSVRREMKDMNKAISTIVNILFSAAGVGFAVGYASYTLTPEIGWRVLMALGAAIVTILAEVWLFAFAGTRGQKTRVSRKQPVAS